MLRRLHGRLLQARAGYERAWSLVSPRERRLRAGFRELRSRFYRELWGQTALALGADLESLGRDIFRIRKAGSHTFVRLSEVMLDDHLSLELAGDKPLTYRLLAEHGLPAPRHLEYSLGNVRRAYRFVEDLGAEAVVKPARGTGGGAGITTGVRTYSQFERASIEASRAGSDLLVEEQVRGSSYRLLYLGGELIDAVRRDPPCVRGDGQKSLRRLVAEENQARLDGARTSALSPLTVDLECRLRLEASGLSMSAIPAAGRAVELKTVVNQNTSQDNHRVCDRVHSSIIRLGKDAVAALGLQLAGVDLITPDVAVPLHEAGGTLSEVNTTPGLHHHYLVSGDPLPVPAAELVLDFIFARGFARRSLDVGARPAPPAST